MKNVSAAKLCWIPGAGLLLALAGAPALAQPPPDEPTSAATPPPLPAEALEGPGGAAAEAFAAGDLQGALQRYEVLLQTEGPSADLLFNLGTTAAWAGEDGRAIWALERARLLAPRDEGVAHNLDVVRQRLRVKRMESRTDERLTDGEPEGVFLFRAVTWLTDGEVGALVIALNLLVFGLLAVRRRMREGGFKDGATVLVGLLAVALLGALGFALTRALVQHQIRVGVVLSAESDLHAAPSSTAPRRTHVDLYSGATVRILDQRSDGWTQLRLVDGTTGWIASSRVGDVR